LKYIEKDVYGYFFAYHYVLLGYFLKDKKMYDARDDFKIFCKIVEDNLDGLKKKDKLREKALKYTGDIIRNIFKGKNSLDMGITRANISDLKALKKDVICNNLFRFERLGSVFAINRKKYRIYSELRNNVTEFAIEVIVKLIEMLNKSLDGYVSDELISYKQFYMTSNDIIILSFGLKD